MKKSAKKTEVIILRYNAPEVEDRCIELVKKYSDAKLTVYDNYEENEVIGVVWNRLIEKSNCEYICLLNSDTEVEEEWLTKMEKVLDDDPLTAVVGCSTNACATIQNQGRGKGVVQTDSLAGFCYLMRKSHWKRAGGFDNRFKFYGQESYLNNVFKNLGLRLKWHKEVFVKHLHSYSAKKADGKGFDYEKERKLGTDTFSKAMKDINKYKPKIVGMMIVKNEEKNIVNCLDKFLRLVEKVYIVDNMSTDKTLEILKGYGNKVEVKQSDDIEGVRRNMMYQMALKDKPDWVIWLDADEEFEPRMEQEILRMARDRNAISWGFREYTFWNSPEEHRVDGIYSRPIRTWSKRMLRADPNLAWAEKPIHPSDITGYIYEGKHKQSDIRIKHWGYMDPKERARKYFHYLRLDGANRSYAHLISQEGMELEKWKD